jgi:hypothetical protein
MRKFYSRRRIRKARNRKASRLCLFANRQHRYVRCHVEDTSPFLVVSSRAGQSVSLMRSTLLMVPPEYGNKPNLGEKL